MPQTLITRPAAVVTGTHQQVAPLPVNGATYIEPVILGTATYGYAAGNAAAPATITDAITLPDVGIAPSVITFVGAAALPITTETNLPAATSWAVPYPSGIQAGDLLIIDGASQDNPTAAAPNTPAGWTSRGSYHPGTTWIPRQTRFWRIATGGETGTQTVTGPSCRAQWIMRAYRGVDQANPWAIANPVHTTGWGQPDPGIHTTTAANALVEISMTGNIFPGGAPDWSPSMLSGGGWTQRFANVQNPRGFVVATKLKEVAGQENPAPFSRAFDNWSVLVDAFRPGSGKALTLVVLTAVTDPTATTQPTAPTLARSEVQRITSSLSSGTFTLSYGGQTTSALNWNATAAQVQTALRALSSIGSTGVTCTGGPLDQASVLATFGGPLANQNLPLLTASSGQIEVLENVPGHPAVTFSYEGAVNIPRWSDRGAAWTNGAAPQIGIWSATPASYTAGAKLTVSVASGGGNNSAAAALLVIDRANTANPISDTLGGSAGDLGRTQATFGAITPSIPGSKILAICGVSGPANFTMAPTPTTPARYQRSALATGDRVVLDVSVSSPAAASPDTPTAVQWSGPYDWVTGLIAVNPAGTAGTLTAIETLNDTSTNTWLELANALGALTERYELNLTGIPPSALITGATVAIEHTASAPSNLRIVLAGIDRDGVWWPCAEQAIGGYPAGTGGAIQRIETRQWTETADGQSLMDFARLGVIVWSGTRNPAVTTHKLYTLAAAVEYEPGGPVVSNVAGPASPGLPVTWDYSSDAGLPQTHAQVRIRHGWGWSDGATFVDDFYSDFETVGAATAVLNDATTWELYNGPGNAGFGRRRPSAIEVVADAAAYDGRALRIRASNGTGGDAGQLVSGGLKILRPIRYGRIEFRTRATGDPNQFFSPVILMWPKLLPGETPGDEWPARGEINLTENFFNRATLTPVEFHVHRLKRGVVPVGPFDSSADESRKVDHLDPWTSQPLNGTTYHKYVVTWLPDRITVAIDDGPERTLVDEPDWIPSGEMEMTIQLDAWINQTLSAGNNPAMFVDYVRLQRLVEDYTPINPLDPRPGDILVDTGKMPGSSLRSHRALDRPLSRDNQTVSVRTWARLANGIEIRSPWVSSSFDLAGNPPSVVAQSIQPALDTATGGITVSLVSPPGITRAWLARSTDSGLTWTLAGPHEVAPDSVVQITDWEAPLASPTLRYQVSFDAGPMTETTAPVPIGAGDISATITSWFMIVPDRFALSTAIEVADYDLRRPINWQRAQQAGRAVVARSRPLGAEINLTIRTRSKLERAKVEAVLESGLPIRLVDILGRSWVVEPVVGIRPKLIRARPVQGETTGLRDFHEIDVSLQEVSR